MSHTSSPLVELWVPDTPRFKATAPNVSFPPPSKKSEMSPSVAVELWMPDTPRFKAAAPHVSAPSSPTSEMSPSVAHGGHAGAITEDSCSSGPRADSAPLSAGSYLRLRRPSASARRCAARRKLSTDFFILQPEEGNIDDERRADGESSPTCDVTEKVGVWGMGFRI